MTLFATIVSETPDAVRVLSAVGDTFGGHGIGFCMRVANVAARFAVYRERDPESIAATFYAGALHRHRLGSARHAARRVAARDRDRGLGRSAGRRRNRRVAPERFPPATADAIRWHREAFDGTGFPDQLRWGSIPETAMTINIARAFVGALEAQGESGSPLGRARSRWEHETGSRFSISTMREFREFLATEAVPPATSRYETAWPLQNIEPTTLIVRICAEIEARQVRTAGRGDRLERIVRGIVEVLADPQIDLGRAAFAARLTALGRTGRDGSGRRHLHAVALGARSRARRKPRPLPASWRPRRRSRRTRRYRRAPKNGTTAAGLPDHQRRKGDRSGRPRRRWPSRMRAPMHLTARDAARRIAAAAGSRLDPDDRSERTSRRERRAMTELREQTRRVAGSRLLDLFVERSIESVVDPFMGLPTHLNYLKRHGIKRRRRRPRSSGSCAPARDSSSTISPSCAKTKWPPSSKERPAASIPSTCSAPGTACSSRTNSASIWASGTPISATCAATARPGLAIAGSVARALLLAAKSPASRRHARYPAQRTGVALHPRNRTAGVREQRAQHRSSGRFRRPRCKHSSAQCVYFAPPGRNSASRGRHADLDVGSVVARRSVLERRALFPRHGVRPAPGRSRDATTMRSAPC